jgi:hypothetical protein
VAAASDTQLRFALPGFRELPLVLQLDELVIWALAARMRAVGTAAIGQRGVVCALSYEENA